MQARAPPLEPTGTLPGGRGRRRSCGTPKKRGFPHAAGKKSAKAVGTVCAQILSVTGPGQVKRVNEPLDQGKVHIDLKHAEGFHWPCLEWGVKCTPHDHQPKPAWPHPHTCPCQTILHADPQRAECADHGVQTERLPPAEAGGRFTMRLQRWILDRLHAASRQALGKHLVFSRHQIHSAMKRPVAQGLERRKA